MKILSIDHSFKRTGFAVMEEYVLCGTGSFSVGKMSYENVYEFYKRVKSLIEQHEPDVIITEKPAHLRNGEISRMLTSLHTIIILASIESSIPYSVVNPKASKKAVTGYGSSTKNDVMRTLVEDYGYNEEMLCNKIYYKKDDSKIKSIDYDESDAVCNAICYLKGEIVNE